MAEQVSIYIVLFTIYNNWGLLIHLLRFSFLPQIRRCLNHFLSSALMSDSCDCRRRRRFLSNQKFSYGKVTVSFAYTDYIVWSLMLMIYIVFFLSARRNLVRERGLGKEVIASGRTLALVSRPQEMQLKVRFFMSQLLNVAITLSEGLILRWCYVILKKAGIFCNFL